MGTHRIHRVTGLALAATAATAAFLGGCATGTDGAGTDGTGTAQSGTVFGVPQQLGNGTVRTYATLDTTGHPTEVGLRLSASALDGLPPNDTPLAQPLELAFPAQAAQTVFDHVMLNWNPHGHDPVALYGKPHFDFHFAMVDHAAMRAIDPADPTYSARAAHLPEARYIPQDYVIPPDSPAAAQAVPGMGVHWVDSTDTTLVPGTYHFTQIVLNGTWDGYYTFVEPMITREWLLTQPAMTTPIKQPRAYQKPGYYPTTYGVHVDDHTHDYVISLGGMTVRTAS